MSTYVAKCDICGTENTVASYGDWDCRQCGQGYTYDEGHQIRLTDSQWALLRSQTRWIPASERLPEDGERVLYYNGDCDRDYGRMVRIGVCIDDGPTGTREMRICELGLKDMAAPAHRATHWMPLPEPPSA